MATIRRLTRDDLFRLTLLGVLFYTTTQAGQYVALAHLPAVTVSLMLSLKAIVVVFLAILLLAEYPGWLQWVGIALFCLGLGIYFYPISFTHGDRIGLVFALVACLATSLGSILGRYINRKKLLSPVAVTVISMSIGSALMLVWGGISEGLPTLGWKECIMVIWMAVVNTASTFSLWNYTLQTLTAMESSIINNTMLVQIAILAWIFLGESIDLKLGLGLVFVNAGVILVQFKKKDIVGSST